MYTREVRKAIEFAVIDCLEHTGKTIKDIHKEDLEPDDMYSYRYGGEPIWHDLNELYALVADRLKFDPEQVLGSARKDETFTIAVNRTISKLRSNQLIGDWKKGSDVFRVNGHLPVQRSVTFSTHRKDFGRYSDRHTSDDELRDMFISMLDSCTDSTYKFAFTRALLDYCFGEEGQARPDPEMPYEYMAGKFIEYYWRLARYGIKQGHRKPESDTLQALSSTFEVGNPTAFSMAEHKYRVEMDNAKKGILEHVFGHSENHASFVAYTFQNISDGDITLSDPVFYETDDDGQYIRVNAGAMRFMRRNYELLSYAVLAKWSIELERLNPGKSKIMTNLAHSMTFKKRPRSIPRNFAY